MTEAKVSKYEATRDMVSREVIACVTDLAEHFISFSDEGDRYANFEEFENVYWYECPECGCVFTEYEDRCPECGFGEHGRAYIMHVAEPLEYWIVSEWLGEQLIEQGECVLKRPLGYIWGRQTSGQSIALDGVMERIAKNAGLFK